MPLVWATRAKATPNLLSLSRMRYFGPTPKAVASRSGTGSPRVRGRACHTDVDHFARVQFDDEEGEERTEEKVSHGKKVARPDLLGMSVNERPPGLSMWSCGAHSSHVLLNGAFANPNAQLEEFASDAFCSPQAVVPCHLLNQGHRLLRDPWLERSCSGLVLPEELEALAVPPRASSLAGR